MPTLTWLKRSFDNLTRGGTRAAVSDGLPSALGRIIRDLEELNRSTEKDFLQVGEKLIEIRAAVQQISSQTEVWRETISGQAGHEVCRALEAMLEHSRGVDARIAQSGETLAGVLDLSSRLRQAFAGLPNTVAVFRTICTLTRIETTRLSSSGVDFGNLAEEVTPLSERIQSSGEGVLNTAKELDRGVQSAMRKGADLQASELKDLHAIAGRVLTSLNSFQEQRQRARDASANQAAQYAAVCEGIDDLVRSIQFHDITRQQVEHVINTLRQLSLHGDVRATLKLQESQLAEAARAFAASVTSIERDLAGIAVRLGEMATASRELMGISSGSQESFFVNMEESLTSILEAAGACGKTQVEMQSLARELETLVHRMLESVGEIRGTEINIERIAINAMIRATQIGGSGNALNVVAEVMLRLAFDSNKNTEDVAQALESMLQAVDGHGDAADRDELGDPQGIYDQMRTAIRELHASSESSGARGQEIAALGARLAEDVSAAGNNFAVGRVFEAAVGRARSALAGLGAQCMPSRLERDTEATARQLDQVAKTYTMQRQRDIHESVITGTALVAVRTGATGPSREGGQDGDLGGNVELF
ncbi:MAG TPA: hypothetical protein VME17_15160 [Bryobacteraceae bacterium]|nr:hypothetical protein [Bryobacteraceae bacterium]